MRGIGIQLNDDYELKLNAERDGAGKLVGMELAKTINQNSAVILVHQSGQMKEAVTLGVGIENILMDHDLAGWRRRIRLALEQDDQQVQTVNVSESKLEIHANY